MSFLGALLGGIIGGIFKALVLPVIQWWQRKHEIERAEEAARRQEHERVEAERLAAELARIRAGDVKTGEDLINDLNDRFR
jgi:type II secretory pathway pseudopilin PulG